MRIKGLENNATPAGVVHLTLTNLANILRPLCGLRLTLKTSERSTYVGRWFLGEGHDRRAVAVSHNKLQRYYFID